MIVPGGMTGGGGGGAKKPKMSSTRCVGAEGNTLTDPVVVGTIAILLMMAPSVAFSVAASGWVCPCGHMVMKPKGPGGTTVALNTKAWAVAGTPHGLPVTFTSRVVLKGGVPSGRRESSTRQGGGGYKDSPP